MSDLISRQAAVDEVHGAIYEFFDICDDDEESPMTYKDEKLLELNKAITIRIKQLPPAEKTGKWLIPQRRGVMSWNEKAYAECSVCHEVIFNARSMKFCPQCGARMEAE